jgi:hypothetical protein
MNRLEQVVLVGEIFELDREICRVSLDMRKVVPEPEEMLVYILHQARVVEIML